ncbi:unnamed protein product [Closterium sp. Naga37s-1]|nr:unnamed protein product [Closterium sp. Naga37s-1]
MPPSNDDLRSWAALDGKRLMNVLSYRATLAELLAVVKAHRENEEEMRGSVGGGVRGDRRGEERWGEERKGGERGEDESVGEGKVGEGGGGEVRGEEGNFSSKRVKGQKEGKASTGLSPVHICTAFHRIAKHAKRMGGGRRLVDRLKEDETVRWLGRQVEALAKGGRLKGQALANVAWAQAELGHGPPSLLNTIMAASLAHIKSFQPLEVAILHTPPSLLNTIMAASLAHIKSFQPLEVAIAQHTPPSLLNTIMAASLAHINSFQPLEVAILMHALGSTAGPPSANASLSALTPHLRSIRMYINSRIPIPLPPSQMHALGSTASLPAVNASLSRDLLGRLTWEHVIGSLHGYQPRHVKEILWAHARVGLHSHLLFREAAKLVLSDMSSYSAPQLAIIAWSFAKLHHSDDSLFRALASWAESNAPEFESQDISNMLWAFARLNVNSPNLFSLFVPRVIDSIQQHSTQSLSNIAWAYATAGHRSQQLLEAVGEESTRRIVGGKLEREAVSGQAVANIAWALATQSHYDVPFFSAAAAHATHYMPRYAGRTIACLAFAFALIGHAAPPLFRRVESEIIRRLSLRSGEQEFGRQALVMLAWALSCYPPLHPLLSCPLISPLCVDHAASGSAGRRAGVRPPGAGDASLGSRGAPLLSTTTLLSRSSFPSLPVPQIIRRLAMRSGEQEFGRQALVMLAWALAVHGQTDIIRRLSLRAGEQEFGRQALVMLAWALVVHGQTDTPAAAPTSTAPPSTTNITTNSPSSLSSSSSLSPSASLSPALPILRHHLLSLTSDLTSNELCQLYQVDLATQLEAPEHNTRLVEGGMGAMMTDAGSHEGCWGGLAFLPPILHVLPSLTHSQVDLATQLEAPEHNTRLVDLATQLEAPEHNTRLVDLATQLEAPEHNTRLVEGGMGAMMTDAGRSTSGSGSEGDGEWGEQEQQVQQQGQQGQLEQQEAEEERDESYWYLQHLWLSGFVRQQAKEEAEEERDESYWYLQHLWLSGFVRLQAKLRRWGWGEGEAGKKGGMGGKAKCCGGGEEWEESRGCGTIACWEAAHEAEKLQVSGLQRDISCALHQMHLPHTLEYRDGDYSIDLALLLPLAPHPASAESDSKRSDSRRRERRGSGEFLCWCQVVQIPFFEWECLSDFHQKQTYLAARLGPLAMQLARAAAAGADMAQKQAGETAGVSVSSEVERQRGGDETGEGRTGEGLTEEGRSGEGGTGVSESDAEQEGEGGFKEGGVANKEGQVGLGDSRPGEGEGGEAEGQEVEEGARKRNEGSPPR